MHSTAKSTTVPSFNMKTTSHKATSRCNAVHGNHPAVNSSWQSPVLLVKKNGILCYCIDYRCIKKVTKKNVPIPQIDDALDQLCNAKYFSSMGFKTGCRQIKVIERDREKNGFIMLDSLYKFKVMPFGLCSATATFQRIMEMVLAGLK